MPYTALYAIIYRVRNITRYFALIFALIYGVQLAYLYFLAVLADAPLVTLIKPASRYLVPVAVYALTPRVFDAVLRRVAQASRRAVR